MSRPVFEIKETPTGSYYFTFKGPDGRTQIISHSFPDRAELENCLSMVRDTAALADVTSCRDSPANPPFFLLQSDKSGVTFSLIGFGGEIIFSSVSFPEEALCREAIRTLKIHAQRAAVADLTVG